MSAIKNYIEVVRKGLDDLKKARSRGVVFVSSNEEQVAECIIEIGDRLDALEAQAHSHKATSDHETCIHRSNCKIYNTPCDYKPDTVQLASQSPAADLKNIQEGTLSVGDTERSCDNCTEYAICANSTPFDNTYANKCDSFNPKQPCAEQDTERSCDDCDHSCSTCLFEKYADKEEPCYSCILEGYNGHKDGWQPKQPRAEQDTERSCDNCGNKMLCSKRGVLCPSWYKEICEQPDAERSYYDAFSDGSLDGSKKVVTERSCENIEVPPASVAGEYWPFLGGEQPRADQVGTPISCAEAIKKSREVLHKAEDERKRFAEEEAERNKCSECDDLRARLAESDAKWKKYEEQYILPCFKISEEMGINLKELVSANIGKNCVELLIADLRARFAESERITRDNGRLEKENAELRRIFPAICASLGNGACCSESSSVEFLREIPNEVSAVIKKMTAENEELKRDLKATRDAIDMKRKEVK